MLKRKIKLSKAFSNAIVSYLEYKTNHFTEKQAFQKLELIYFLAKKIASQKNYPLKKIKYRNSKNLQYFVFLEHAILFKLSEKEMVLKYFVAVKRFKKPL
jgi:HD superfamily phosphohydrolase YqeK